MNPVKVKDTAINNPDAKVIPISKDVETKPKISLFGSAKVKPTKASPKSDKTTIVIPGLETKLKELQSIKAEIEDLKAQLTGITDEVKGISKEKFIELYKANHENPNTFIIQDGEGCVMVLPMDKYIKIEDEARAEQLIAEYGEDTVTIVRKFYFTPEVLARNQEAIEKLIMESKDISESDKENLITQEVEYSIAKGFIDKLYPFGDRMGNVIDDIQPIFMLKNCGGSKMAQGGDFHQVSGDLIMEMPIMVGYSLCHYAPVYGEAEICSSCGHECSVISEEELKGEIAQMANEGGYEEGSDELEQRWEARKYFRGGSFEKDYEISLGNNVYWGKYHYEGNRLFVDSCFTNNEDEQEIEITDNATIDSFYGKLERETADEVYELVDRDEYAKGGGVKRGKNKWIASAISSGHKGALRKHALREGLLRGKKDKLSLTDLHKLEKEGGKTAKRAYLAETLSKFDKGGAVDKKKYGFSVGEKVICNGAEDEVIGFITPADKENWDFGYRLVLKEEGTQSLGSVAKKFSVGDKVRIDYDGSKKPYTILRVDKQGLFHLSNGGGKFMGKDLVLISAKKKAVGKVKASDWEWLKKK